MTAGGCWPSVCPSGGPLLTTTIVVFGLPGCISGGVTSSLSSGIGAMYSFNTFFSCGRLMGLELAHKS